MTSNVKELLKEATSLLQEKGISTPFFDASYLLAFTLEINRAELSLYDKEITHEKEALFLNMIKERATRKPVSRIIGKRGFWKLDFTLNNSTLDPRPDSETLIEAVETLYPNKDKPLHILDLGTGTGCLLLSLLYDYPYADGTGIDISGEALIAAQKNAADYGLDIRTKFINANWNNFAKEANKTFDIIISNPPYIPSCEIPNLEPEVKDFDPLTALDGGKDGLICYQDIASFLKQILKSDGTFLCEIGQNQENDIIQIFSDAGFKLINSYQDLGGIVRILAFSHI